MSINKLFLSLFSVLVFGIIFSYGLVLAGPLAKVDSGFALSKNLFADSLELSSNKVIIKSSQRGQDFEITGDCSTTGNLEASDGQTHIFNIKLGDKECKKENVEVMFKTGFKTIKHNFSVIHSNNLYNRFLDYSTEDLQRLADGIEKSISSLKNNSFQNSETKVVNDRKIKELGYFKIFFSNILSKRSEKYLIPVKGIPLPTRETKVPNSGRPYRASYTDGIHHGWDFDAKKGSTIVSIDDGIVLRIVNGFNNLEFSKLKRDGEITDQDKLTNLDILRGNQVWIKTMKGDVAFYAHLNQIFPEIKEGMFLKRGQAIGTIGVSGVPDDDYDDYHIHLAIQKNPLDTSKAGKYTFLDYMAWPWYFKGQTAKYVLEHQTEVFDKN
ncbi:hypothetical protein BKN14_03465 [Candidatus Gracilibacteria bacterium HOT-871]|nr:hypothetical protein BKN14_03465 [Candidatus Gracilibacteria bacterium HOT-871]